MNYHRFDCIIVGAGGAGMMAALEASKRAGDRRREQALPHPLAHRRGAGGDRGRAVPTWRAIPGRTTPTTRSRGGDFLVDQTAAETLCREAIDCIYDLEHMGLPFDRTEDGRISQRRFGGHTKPNPDYDKSAAPGTPNARPRVPGDAGPATRPTAPAT